MTEAGQSWVKITLELVESDAWRSLSINGRRFIDFLIREHLRHGGKENGRLKAPYGQLETFGAGARYLADTIREVDDLGLVDCQRHGRRIASTYALTWLPLHDDTPASNRWRAFRNPDLPPLPTPKSKNLPAKGKVALPAKGKVDGPKLPAKGKVDGPKTAQNLPAKGKVLSRILYQGSEASQKEKEEDAVVFDRDGGTASSARAFR